MIEDSRGGGRRDTGRQASRPATAGLPFTEPSAGANKCFVCAPDNPIGLHLTFRLEDGACVSQFTPGENHQGYPGVIHGGMIYSALDDVMANWLYLRGARAYTARCEIRYRSPRPRRGNAATRRAPDGAQAKARGDGGDREARIGRRGRGDRDGDVRGDRRGGVCWGGGGLRPNMNHGHNRYGSCAIVMDHESFGWSVRMQFALRGLEPRPGERHDGP